MKIGVALRMTLWPSLLCLVFHHIITSCVRKVCDVLIPECTANKLHKCVANFPVLKIWSIVFQLVIFSFVGSFPFNALHHKKRAFEIDVFMPHKGVKLDLSSLFPYVIPCRGTSKISSQLNFQFYWSGTPCWYCILVSNIVATILFGTCCNTISMFHYPWMRNSAIVELFILLLLVVKLAWGPVPRQLSHLKEKFPEFIFQ